MNYKHHNILFFTVLLLFLSINFAAQTILVVEPTIGNEYNFSKEVLEVWKTKDSLQKLVDKKKIQYKELSAIQQEIVEVIDMPRESVWSVLSWYKWREEIGYESIKASSFLQKQGNYSYTAEKISDLSYRTAWIEGVLGNGIGEFITFELSTSLSEITTVIIANGYIKSKEIWKNNARVKRLKMYVNNKPHAILNLKDVYASQIFEIPVIGYSKKENREFIEKMENRNVTRPFSKKIKFEILEVYLGDKYTDTAITEIYFEGKE